MSLKRASKVGWGVKRDSYRCEPGSSLPLHRQPGSGSLNHLGADLEAEQYRVEVLLQLLVLRAHPLELGLRVISFT